MLESCKYYKKGKKKQKRIRSEGWKLNVQFEIGVEYGLTEKVTFKQRLD